MFGVDMRLPVETALAKDLPAHRRPTENVDLMTKQLTMMRSHAQALAQQSRERGAKTANKHKHTYEFKPGDRVYKIRDALGDSDDRKTATKFLGPYVILERGANDVYKLANFYTGRAMKNFVHVDKLKSCQNVRAAKDTPRTITTINTSEHDNSERIMRERTCKPQGNPHTGPAAGTNNETSDFQTAFGNAEIELAFDCEPDSDRGTPEGQTDAYDDDGQVGKIRRYDRRTPREGNGRGTPHFPYSVTRPRRKVMRATRRG